LASLGLSSRVVDGHPVVLGVRVGRDGAAFGAEIVINHRPVRHSAWPDKLALVAGEVETYLRQNKTDSVVVKTIEQRTPVGAPKLDDASRMRLHLEGVLLVTAQPLVPIVQVLNGQELGHLFGSDKATIEAEGVRLVGKRKELVEAAAAGIGAVLLAESAA
jgi:hypothetical protein